MSLIVVALFAASAYDRVFDEGVAAYNNGAYPAAIAAFEQLIGEGVAEPEVFFNLGNAYYRNGELAPTIANYERTLQLDPAAESARENLTRAIAQTERGLSRPRAREWEEGVFFWHGEHTPGRSLVSAAVCWWLAWGLLALRLARPWPYLRAAAATAIALAALFGASWWIKIHPEPMAVASGERVAVRYGNRPGETIRFELYEGDRVMLEDRKDGWTRVRTADGERGWAEDAEILPVGPPYESYRGRARAKAPEPAAPKPAPETTP